MLLRCCSGQFLEVILELQDIDVQHVLQRNLIVRPRRLDLHPLEELVPVAVQDGDVRVALQEREDLPEALDGSL